MNNKEAAKELSFSVNLPEQALWHLDFLKKIDSVPELKRSDVLKRSLLRYEKYWLPLAAEHAKECLVPPLDIDWIWHCHMLSPIAYENDCKSIVGTTINHTLYDANGSLEGQNKSREYWLQKFSATEEPFDVDFSAFHSRTKDDSFTSKLSYDILAAAERQTTFYYQVALPHYKDDKFLDSSLLRYKQFLYMKTKVDQQFLVPCYDIDLIWHTHQLNPVLYKTDMVGIIGHLFNHDDSDSNRSEGSVLDNAGKETSKNWKTFYDEDYAVCGAMYRGKPPNGRLSNITKEDGYAHGRKTYKISFESLTLVFSSDSPVRSSSRITLFGSEMKNDVFIKRCFELKRKQSSLIRTGAITWTDVDSFECDPEVSDSISFELRQQKGRACYASETVVAQNKIDIALLLGEASDIDTEPTFDVQVKLSRNFSVSIKGKRSMIQSDMSNLFLNTKTTLFLETGKHTAVVIPDDVQQLLGPVDIEGRQPGGNNVCQVALHRLKNEETGDVEFTVKVIHAVSLLKSVIQVFYHDKMIALAHLISTDQLPTSSQVIGDDMASLDPSKGCRAVLIKNNQGDWAIATGQWVGFKRGKAGTSCFRAEYGNTGWLQGKLYKFPLKATTFNSQHHRLALNSCTLDLKRSSIEINTKSGTSEIGENIAAVFSVALLYAMCVPRPKGWEEGDPIDPVVNVRGKKCITKDFASNMPFMNAAGLFRNTPSNYYISKHLTKYDGEWKTLPGGGDNDGCACSTRNDSNKEAFDSGTLGPGCGGVWRTCLRLYMRGHRERQLCRCLHWPQ